MELGGGTEVGNCDSLVTTVTVSVPSQPLLREEIVMLEYVQKCRAKYPGNNNRTEFVRCVLDGALKAARRAGKGKAGGPHDSQIVERASLALLDLSKKRERDQFVSKKEVRSQAVFKSYEGSGLWPWLARNDNADVVEESSGEGYRIRPKFYEAFDKVVGSLRGTGSGKRRRP